MQAKFEQALEAVRSLSTQDDERLWRWMQERRQEKHAQDRQFEPSQSLSFNENDWQERAAKIRRALRWIDEHRQEYLGQWVCLDGDQLISHGIDAKEVYKDAKSGGIKIPFVEQAREEEPAPFWGGWN